jgi:hypothetical protein
VNWRNRKLRLALILGLAVFIAFTAWRMGQANPAKAPCEPGRQVEKDAAGKVVKITNRTCIK